MPQKTYRAPPNTTTDGPVRFRFVRTEDGTVIGFDPASGIAVSRLTREAAGKELTRLTGCGPPGA
jgi:hypothetical protein